VIEHHKFNSIDDLRDAPYNPRDITDKSDKALGASLDEYGDISGIVFNKRTGNLVCGHQRVRKLREQGAVVDGDKIVCGSNVFDIRVVDWDLTKEKAANISANNTALCGAFTQDVASVLDDVKEDVGREFFSRLLLDEVKIPKDVDSDALLDDHNKPTTDQHNVTKCPKCGFVF
jgi:hypothetical protein